MKLKYLVVNLYMCVILCNQRICKHFIYNSDGTNTRFLFTAICILQIEFLQPTAYQH
jgi:hypothetical protein